MSGYQAALDYLAKRNGPTNQSPDPLAAPTPAQGAQIIDFETPLPEMEGEPDFISIPEDSEETLTAPAYESAPAPSQPMGDGYTAALAYLERQQADQQAQAATQQAVAEATTPDQNLPVLKPELADALGVLDYRDPQEGARRSQAAALGEILGLPEYEKVQLGAAPVNADGTVTIRRAQAVSPEANAAAAKQLENLRIMAAGEMLVEDSPKEVGTLQGIANAAQNAFDSARQALMATDGLDENDAAQLARIEYNKAARRVAPGYAAYQQAEGWDAVKAFAKNPFEVSANIITEGLAGSWPALASGLATGATTAAVAGAAGSVVPGAGNVIGAGGGFTAGMVGGTAAGSFATEYGSKILEELQTAGMNPKNPESIAKFFSNETLMAEAKDAAFKRGVPVAAFDALSAGIAGRVGSVFRAAAKTPVRLAATEGVIQGGLGAGGEISGSLAAGDPVNPKAVFGEVLGEVGPAAIEIAAGRAASASQPAPMGTPSSPTAPPSSAPITQPAPAEVPQNFTPISSPAPAATSPAPRTLGQVRAPQIAIDQAALDETFGPATPIPPNTSTAPAAASGAPASTGSPELIAGEGASVSTSQPAPPIESLFDVGEQGNIKGIKPQVAATAAEYEKTYPLTERKREIKNAGYPPEQVEQFVAQNYKPSKFATLLEPHRGNIVFLEAPSTSESNTIPFVFANKLASDFGGSVIKGNQYATSQAISEAKDKKSYISKMEDPSRFTITDPDLASKLSEKFVVLVDDFVTSGETLDGLTESLTAAGIKPQGIVAIGAAKGSKPATSANLKSLATKLSRMLNEPQRRIEEDLQLAHGHSRLNLIRRADDDSTRNPSQVRELIARKAELVRQTLEGRKASPQEGNNLAPSISSRPGGVSSLQNVEGQTALEGVGPRVVGLPSQQAQSPSGLESSPPSQASPRKPLRADERGGVLIPSREDLIQAGQNLYEAGMDFAAWAGRMVQQFGEAVREFLSEVWQAVSGGQYLPQARERGSVNIGTPKTSEPKPRKFSQSLQAAPGVAPEVKSRLTSLDYNPVSNAQTLANARARIDSAGSIDTAFTDLMGKPAIEGWQPTAEDYATGMELMGQLQNRNRHADAASIANMMATRATDQGRAIQALSMIGRLGPQGIELFAQSQLQAAATKPAKTDKQKADIQAKITEAGQLQGEVDKLRRDSTTAAIVANKDLIKSSLPAGVDAVQVNIAIREAILGAPTPLAAQAATSSILTGQGLSDKGAARISGSIVRDFLKTTQDTRAKVLQDLLATADSDRRLDKSKLGSLIRLNREGKLTDASLHAGMAKMLGIPHWSAEHSAKVRRILAQHEKATDPRIKLVKAAEALDVVYRDFMPPGFLDKVDAIQTIAMLLNPKTVIRNVVGNTFMAGADLAADTVSVPMDALVSLGTGQRTRTGLSLGERIMGLGAGVGDIKAGYDFARSEGRGRIASIAEGVDTLVRLGRLQSSGKYNASDISALSGPTFTAPVLRQLESTLGLVLSISDRGFYESAFRASLDTRMKAAAANGTPMLAPDTDMVAAARMDAARAIYQDPNVASRTLGGMRRVMNLNQRWGIGSMLMKFTQVPGSLLTRAVEFSPLGFINTAYQSLAPMLSSSREFDQKAFTDSFSRALVGTTGLIATGYWLTHLGILTAGSDAKDEDKRNLNRAMGWGSYKINVSALKRALMTGNFWTPQKQQRDDMVIGYDWAQPLSIGVAMGAYSRENQEAIKQDILAGKKQSLAATGLNWLAYAGGAATGAMNSLVEQPLLTGLNQFARDVGYDNIPGAILKTAADAPGTFIPTAARQWMQLTDNAVRETRDSSPARQFINELKAQLPGQSQTLPPKYDITGQPVERWAKDSNTLFNVLFNPSMVSYIKGSPALTEMSKVYKYTAETGAVPNQVKPEFTVEGVKVRLTSEEISAMQKDMGALSIAALEKFVLSDPRYDKATWDIKAKAMTRALEKASTAAKYRILMSRPDLKTRAKQEYDAIQANRAATQSDMLAPVGP